MTNEPQSKRTKVHPELSDFDILVTKFGEIEGSMNIDQINRFLNKNVEDKKLNNQNINTSNK